LKRPPVEELSEWLRIPSVSADPAHAADVERAGEWLCDTIREAGGHAELVSTARHPLVVGELRASNGANGAPTLLVYGHFDVQPPAPVELWDSPPFEPTVVEDWLVARGAVDDKGQLYMLLRAAVELAGRGELPVNVRFACDGEEEIGGNSIVEFIERDDGPADACVIFDAGMERRGVPLFFVSTRGALAYALMVRAGRRDLHSANGNAAQNAVHALLQTLSAILPRGGRLPEDLRAGAAAPTDAERAAWEQLKSGAERLADLGAVPYDDAASQEYYLRTSAEPSVDVNGILGGKPGLVNTTIPAVAQANFTVRLAPGQDVATIDAAVRRLLDAGAPAGVELDLVREAAAAPARVPLDEPFVRVGCDVFERVLGVRPLLVRGGGTLPVLSAVTGRGVPAIVTGFGLPESNTHSPNERLPLEYLSLGIEAARELYRALARTTSSSVA
jgi:acetylornithine deacetylase/succinyl-diaminopimelate desuccinylase-like protein